MKQLVRSQYWSGWLVLLLCFGLSACGQKVPTLPHLAPDDVVLAFGDSLTYGTGAGTDESYPAVLSGLIGREVIGAGVPGERTTQGLARLPDELERYRPKIMVLCLGGNDMLRKVSAREIEANLRHMVELARDKGVAVLLVGVPRPALFAGTANFYERIAEDLELAYEGEVLNDILRDEKYKSDPIHPNAEGYRLFAQAVAAVLRRAGAI